MEPTDARHRAMANTYSGSQRRRQEAEEEEEEDEQQQQQTAQQVAECYWIEGIIVGRRVLGKHLAFATLQLAGAASTHVATKQDSLQAKGIEKSVLAKVKFRRQDPATDAIPQDGATVAPRRSVKLPIVWEGAADSKVGPSLQHHDGKYERAELAPFPQRRSQLQLGARVAVKVCSQVPDAPLGVVKWRVIAQVGEDPILQQAQLATNAAHDCAASSPSKTGAHRATYDLHSRLHAVEFAGGVGAGAGALASAGGAFSVADRLRVRQLAHSDALAARASGQSSSGFSDDPTQAPLCKYWMANGVCEAHQLGNCYGFRHEFTSAEDEQRAARSRMMRATSLEASKQVQRIYDAATDFPAADLAADSTAVGTEKSWLVLPDSLKLGQPECEPELQSSTRHLGHGGETKQQKGRRAAAFVAWLLETYGTQALNEGSGVLDVAGGKGAISYELHCRHGINCTLVDPGVRTRLLTPRQARALRKNGGTPFVHIAACFDEAFCASKVPVRVAGATTTTEELLRRASLVVGMHPDEATEAIVSHSLAHGKRFAVVPCCVFAHLFPNRMLSSAADSGGGSKPVRDINDFCAYLKAMDPRIEEAALSFEGRNKVLFMR